MSEVPIGRVTHYYGKISVAVLNLTDAIRLGDTVHILGRTTDFQQEVGSLQIEHQAISEAKPGQEVALKVDYPVRRRDSVFKVVA
jgi:translation elongation factor EF-1alpha